MKKVRSRHLRRPESGVSNFAAPTLLCVTSAKRPLMHAHAVTSVLGDALSGRVSGDLQRLINALP